MVVGPRKQLVDVAGQFDIPSIHIHPKREVLHRILGERLRRIHVSLVHEDRGLHRGRYAGIGVLVCVVWEMHVVQGGKPVIGAWQTRQWLC